MPEPLPVPAGELPHDQAPEPILPHSQPERHLHLVEEVEPPQPKRIATKGIARSLSGIREKRALLDLQLVMAAQKGDVTAINTLVGRYKSFVKLKSSVYFIAGAENDDVMQEGYVGLYKAIRDFDPACETTFRGFAELCIIRQIITAVKTANRHKHSPLNSYVSFSHTPANQEGEDVTLGDALPGPWVNDPLVKVISTQELQALVDVLSTRLTPLESDVLRLYMEGNTYDQIAAELGINFKSVDNAFQRVKRKVLVLQESRQVLQ